MPNTQQSGKGAAYIQVDPLAEMEFLTAIGTNSFTVPRRAQTTTYLPALLTGEFEPDDFVAGDMSEATVNFTRPLFDVYNHLLELDCRFNMRLQLQCSGERSVKQNFAITLLLIQAIFETAEIDTMTVVTPDENGRINTTGSAKSLKWGFLRKLKAVRQAITATQAINDLAFLPPQCYSKCAIYRGLGQVGYAALDTDYVGVYGDVVLKTVNYGADWLGTATSPFTTLGRNAQAVIVIPLTGTEHRVVVGGGPMLATYPEIGYSDGTRNTAGNVWTNVNPAAAAGHAALGINAFARDSLGRLFAAADDGRIYRSDDLASTWSISENGVETGEDVNGICFYGTQGYAVCDNNVVLRKQEDSDDWAAIVGPVTGVNLLAVETNYLGYVFVTTAGSEVWMSYDEGDTWNQVATNIPAAGTMPRIVADPWTDYVMWLLRNDTASQGIVYRSEDGGVTFEPLDMTALHPNNGLNALAVVDMNTATVGGEVVAGTGFIGKFQRR